MTTKTRLNLLTSNNQTAMLLVGPGRALTLPELHQEIQQVLKHKFGLKHLDTFCLVSGKELELADLQNNLTICVSSSASKATFDVSKRLARQDPSALCECEIRVIGQEFSQPHVVSSLSRFAQMPGVVSVLALPDLSAAVPCPVGTSVTVSGRLYPSWIGTDIGCGISLLKLKAKSLGSVDKLIQRLSASYTDKWSAEGQARAFRERFMTTALPPDAGVCMEEHDDTFGSIGAGNHFCELQECHATGELYLAVHSGSRSLGVALSEKMALLCEGELDIARCLALQRVGMEWARLNRLAIAKRVVDLILPAHGGARFDSTEDDAFEPVLDVCHNFIQPAPESTYIHRKGAIPTDLGPVLIPGSRGTNSYLVVAPPTSELNSLPHGAGRRYTKADAEKKFSTRASHQEQQKHVICNDKKLLAQEAPGAYKDIDEIMHLLVSAGHVAVLQVFRPLLTLKYNGI